MDQTANDIEKLKVLDFLNNETRAHVLFVCEEYEDIHDVLTNFCNFLTHQLLDSDSKPLATNIVSKAFKASFQHSSIPTLKEYSNRPNTFKCALFNELSMLSRYSASGQDLLSGHKVFWDPRQSSFSQWSAGRIKPETLHIDLSNQIDTSNDFRIAVAIQIFDCLQFIQEETENA